MGQAMETKADGPRERYDRLVHAAQQRLERDPAIALEQFARPGRQPGIVEELIVDGDGWIGFNLLPDEAAGKIKRIEELLKANGRKRSDVKLAVSPYTKPIKTDDLKRYRDAGVEEIALLGLGGARTEQDMRAALEQMARDFVEPAARL
jgi:hypothetical protein